MTDKSSSIFHHELAVETGSYLSQCTCESWQRANWKYGLQHTNKPSSILKRSLAGALNPFWKKYTYIYMRILVNLNHPKEILKNRTTNLIQPDQDWVVRSTPCWVPWVVIWRYIWSSIWEGEERSIIRDRHDAFLRRMDIPHVEAGRSWGHAIRPSCGFPANNLEVLNILKHHVFYHDLPAFAFEVQTFISTWPEVFRKKIWFCQTYPSPSTRLSAWKIP